MRAAGRSRPWWLVIALALVAFAVSPFQSASGAEMHVRRINAAGAPAPHGGYAQALEVNGARRLLFISGQIPVSAGGDVPTGFDAQCRLVWANVAAQLAAAGMTLDNLVKVTTYLSDRRHAAQSSQIRRELLGDRAPALTVLIAGIYDEAWLLEVEAVAAD